MAATLSTYDQGELGHCCLQEKRMCGLGIIARDFMEKVCASRSITVRQLLEPVVPEAMAGLHAMMMGKELITYLHTSTFR